MRWRTCTKPRVQPHQDLIVIKLSTGTGLSFCQIFCLVSLRNTFIRPDMPDHDVAGNGHMMHSIRVSHTHDWHLVEDHTSEAGSTSWVCVGEFYISDMCAAVCRRVMRRRQSTRFQKPKWFSRPRYFLVFVSELVTVILKSWCAASFAQWECALSCRCWVPKVIFTGPTTSHGFIAKFGRRPRRRMYNLQDRSMVLPQWSTTMIICFSEGTM
jgi:hypothetical protein